jgi:ketosteroid isomerase-like protein
MSTGEIAATGKPIEVRACLVIMIMDGKAHSIRQYFDVATLMRQLGIKA